MIKVRDAIEAQLKLIHPRAYFLRAPKGAQLPYLVYTLTTSFMLGEQEVWPLEVDAWDNDADSATVDALSRQVADTLHRWRYVGDGISLKVYREGRMALDDDDARIKRRRVMFQVRSFDLVKRTGE